MKRTALLAILLFFAMAAKPAQAVPVPLEVYVVIPADYPEFFDFSQSEAEVSSWMADVQDWFQRQIGKTFDYNVTVHYSQYDIYDLNGPASGLDGCLYAPIPEGQGLVYTQTLGLLYPELGLSTSGVGRHIFIVVGGGGWAGANPSLYIQGQNNYGWVLLGDWGLSEQISGSHDPCNPYGGAGPCDPDGVPGPASPCIDPSDPIPDPNPCGALGHELLHTFLGPSHPMPGCGETLSTQQKRDLTRNGKPFFY